MPYNTSAIPPAEEITGHSALPLSRVKKIIRLDEEVSGCSNNAAFLVTVAAEMFVQYLAEQGLKMTYGDRKQRKTMQYKDLANAVARIDNLEFLADVIPPTVPFKQIREKKNKAAKDAGVGQPQLMMTGPGAQKILPIGAPNGSKNNGSGKAKSKATTPEIDTLIGNDTIEEDAGGMVEVEVEGDSGVEEPKPSKKNGLERFLFDNKNKSRDGEPS